MERMKQLETREMIYKQMHDLPTEVMSEVKSDDVIFGESTQRTKS